MITLREVNLQPEDVRPSSSSSVLRSVLKNIPASNPGVKNLTRTLFLHSRLPFYLPIFPRQNGRKIISRNIEIPKKPKCLRTFSRVNLLYSRHRRPCEIRRQVADRGDGCQRRGKMHEDTASRWPFDSREGAKGAKIWRNGDLQVIGSCWAQASFLRVDNGPVGNPKRFLRLESGH